MKNKYIDFMKYRFLYFAISAIVIVPGVASLLVWGLRPSVDFTGGSVLEVKFDNPPLNFDQSSLDAALGGDSYKVSSLQSSGDRSYILKFPQIDESQKNAALEKIKSSFGGLQEVRFETVGPTLGKELLKKTMIAVVLASLAILSYVAWRFKNAMYGICAVLAMFHDSLVLLGIFSLLGHFFKVEVDTLYVTAVLTILSFSVHDTVVVYDRIRESVKRYPQLSFFDLVNRAVNETLTRSLNNSMTIIFMLLALALLGGGVIRPFALALLVGTVTGTYSSTFTAAPLLVVWDKARNRKNVR